MQARVPAATHGEQVGAHTLHAAACIGDLHDGQAQPAARACHAAAGDEPRTGLLRESRLGGGDLRACVHHRLDLRAGAVQVGDRPPAIVARGEDHGAPARQGSVAVDVATDGARQHHARPVVAAEDHRAFQRTRRQHDAACRDLPVALPRQMRGRRGQVVRHPLQRRDQAAIKQRERAGAAQDADPRQRGELRLHAPRPVGAGDAVHFLSLGEQAAAEQCILLQQRDAGAGPAGGQRGHQPSGAATDDEDVAMQVRPFVMVGVCALRRAAEPGGAADQRLIELLPEAGRPHESLVVEACTQHRREEPVDRAEVEGERGKAVLAPRFEPVEQLRSGGAGVRLPPRAAAQLDKRVGLLRPRSQDAARAMVLEGTADEMDAIRDQRGGERIAREARQAFPVEGEREVGPTLHQPAGGQAEGLARDGVGDGRRGGGGGDGRVHAACSRAGFTESTAWVRVSRSTTSQVRQP